MTLGGLIPDYKLQINLGSCFFLNFLQFNSLGCLGEVGSIKIPVEEVLRSFQVFFGDTQEKDFFIFTNSALWDELVRESTCPCVCVCVCVSV